MRQIIKKAIQIFFYICVLPIGLPCRYLNKWFNISIVFHFWAQVFSMVPDPLGQYVRGGFYKQTLEQCSLNVLIYFGSLITKMETRIGDLVYIGGHNMIGMADIRDRVVIANGVSILSGRRQHNFDDPDVKVFNGKTHFSRIYIGQDSFIGEQSIIMADVGDYSIIGAGAVVTKPIADYKIAMGNPAKVIKDRKEDLQ